MRPTDCPKCQAEFLRRPLLQAEARHTGLTIGVRTAQADVDEALDEYHANHGGPR